MRRSTSLLASSITPAKSGYARPPFAERCVRRALCVRCPHERPAGQTSPKQKPPCPSATATPRPSTRGRSALQHSLTDAEWALVADLFERPHGGRGAPARYERRHLAMPAAMCCVPAAPGGFYRQTSRRGKRSTKPSCVGSRPMPSSTCTTVFASSGDRAWAAVPSRLRQSSMHSPIEDHLKVANPATTLARR